ncbi:glycosyltransferase [Patescibacteria group bacterium]|nr:glycosyltransferase [Patescibacteria group bacterium]
MNIGFFTDTYRPGYSGVETSIDLFKQELERQGHTVYIFAPTDDKRLNTPEENEQGIYRLQSAGQDIFPEFKMTFPVSDKVFKNFGNFDLDIIHSHTPFIMGFYASFVGFTLNIPVVHTYHTFYEKYSGHSFLSKQKNADRILMQAIKKISLLHPGRCEAIIAPSAKMKTVLEDYGVKNPINVIPTGIDLKVFNGIDKKSFRQKKDISPEKQVLIFVGRLGQEKNIKFLIKVTQKLAKINPDILLVIVGAGPEREKLEAEGTQKNVSQHVKFLGQQSKIEVREAYAGSNIFCFASLTDTQSLSLLEAAVSGLPIVMLEDKGLTEVMVDGVNGYTIPDNDSEKFADKISKILKDDDLRKRMSEASKQIGAQLSIEKQTIKLIAFYHESMKEYFKDSLRTKFKNKLHKDVDYKKFFNAEKNKKFFKKLGRKTKDLFNKL